MKKVKSILSYLVVTVLLITGCFGSVSSAVYAADSKTERDWSVYSTRYHYNLMSDKDKELYDKMDKVCSDYLEGKTTAQYNSLGKMYHLDEIYVGDTNHTHIIVILEELIEDNPQYFFTSTCISSSSDDTVYLYCYNEFADSETFPGIRDQLFDKIDSWCDEINASCSTRYEKEKMANEMLVKNVSYNRSQENNFTALDQSMYSTFILGETVCKGYALGMNVLMNKLEVPCFTLNGGLHAWNKVCLDDDNWYNVDVCWNDQGATSSNRYMNQSDDAIQFNDRAGEHSMINSQGLPESPKTYYPPGEKVVYDGSSVVIVFSDDENNNNETSEGDKEINSTDESVESTDMSENDENKEQSSDGTDDESKNDDSSKQSKDDSSSGNTVEDKSDSDQNKEYNSEQINEGDKTEDNTSADDQNQNNKKDDKKEEQNNNSKQKNDKSSDNMTDQNNADKQNSSGGTDNNAGLAPTNNSPYSNEWIDGKWYDEEGSQTYEGILEWKSNSTGWWVEDSAGWFPQDTWEKIDGVWYFFKPDGYLAQDEWYNGYWFNADGSWTYDGVLTWKCNSSGWWVEDSSGWYAKSCWEKIDGNWYYFGSDGYMVTSQYVDGYWIDANGVSQ